MFKIISVALLILSVTAQASLAEIFPVKRCVNFANGLDAPFEGAWGYRIDDAHITSIAEDGFDTIRLPVRFQAGYTNGQINPAMLDRVDHLIRVALAHDLNVVLDFHHFAELMEDHNSHADLFVDIWRELSAHYQGWSNKLMFELLNEPTDQVTTTRANALYARVFPFLRDAHPKRWIIVGGGEWSSIAGLADLAPNDEFTVHTFHYYDPFDFTHQTAEWVDLDLPKRGPPDTNEIARVESDFKALDDYPLPLFLGEFGVYNVVSPDERALWMETVRRAAEKAGIGWCHWGYVSGFRLAEDDLTWLPGLKEALFSQ